LACSISSTLTSFVEFDSVSLDHYEKKSINP